MTQLSFWGFNEDGDLTANGKRFVYFVDEGEFIKIGFTGRDPETRKDELATGNPRPLNIIGSILVTTEENDRDLQDLFREYHYRREWFRNTPELLDKIQRLIRYRDLAHAQTWNYENHPYGALFSVGCWKCGALVWFASKDSSWDDLAVKHWPWAAAVAICRVCEARTPIRIRPREDLASGVTRSPGVDNATREGASADDHRPA